jgi:hypothetical protein
MKKANSGATNNAERRSESVSGGPVKSLSTMTNFGSSARLRGRKNKLTIRKAHEGIVCCLRIILNSKTSRPVLGTGQT